MRAPGKHGSIFALKAAQARVRKALQTHQRDVIAARAARNTIRYNTKEQGDSNTYKALKDPPGKPMTFVTTGEGEITADPEVVDDLARKAWKDVYDGTGGEEEEIVNNFIQLYERYIPRCSQGPDLGDITAEDVEYALKTGSNSTAGPDGWKPSELKWMSKTFCKWLAVIFNLAEKGNGWPKDLLCARSAYISKEEEPNIKDLLKYRVITVLPAVYRAWSRMRYNHCSDWAATWADEAQYSACRGRGAQEAWWNTSIEMESDRAEGNCTAVAFFDMAKCYDMIPRKLAYEVLRRLGMPSRVLEAWSSYLENLQFYNTIGATAGKMHGKARSLPQGDSWSTRALAGLLVIWAGRLREMDATPRFLADDMFVKVSVRKEDAEKHMRVVTKVEEAITETLHFIKNMGGLAQLHKCAVLAGEPAIRTKLRGKRWGPEAEPIPVSVDIRDLGSHFSCGKRPSAKTLKARIEAAIPIAKRVGKMRLTTRRRMRILRAKVFAKALYGVEATALPEKSRAKLQAAVLDAAGGFRGRTRSPALGLYATDIRGLDVRAEIAKRRIKNLVKRMRKERGTEQTARRILRAIDEGDLDITNAKGPITLIVKDLKGMGAELKEDLTLKIPGEKDTRIMEEPLEVTTRKVAFLAQRKCFEENARTRPMLQGVKEVLQDRTGGAYDVLDEGDKKVMRYIMAGGLWTGKHAQKATGADEASCRSCGAATATMQEAHKHMFWECNHDKVKAFRSDAWRFQEGFDPELLPDLMACHGTALMLHLDPEKTFSGSCGGESWRSPKKPQMLEAEEVIQTNNEQEPVKNARQLLEDLKGDTGIINPEEAPLVWRKAPKQPNVFSDGSALPPGTGIETLGGAGVWWPKRTLEKQPATRMEEKYAKVTQCQEGVKVSAALGGAIQSPMRAELCGAILAMAGGVPIHLAIDNSSVVKGIKKALHEKRRARAFDWQGRENEDLWEVLWRIVKSRPNFATKVKWTKGHATQDHIDDGLTTKQEAANNDMADRAADEGRLQHKEELRAIEEARADYEELINTLRVYMLLTIKKRMDIMGEENVEEVLAQKTSAREVPFRGLPPPREGPSKNFVQIEGQGVKYFYRATSKTRSAMKRFLLGIKYRPGDSGSKQGVTWLELGLLFEFRTGIPMPRRWPPGHTNAEILHGKGPAIGQHVDAFRQGILEAIKTTVNNDDRHQFKPVTRPNVRLHGLGVMNVMAGVRMEPELTKGERENLEDAILKLRGLSAEGAQAVREGRRSLLLQRFRVRGEHVRAACPGAADGENAMAQRAGNTIREALCQPKERTGQEEGKKVEAPFAYKCPGCGAVTQFEKKPVPLQTRGWPKHRCQSCSRVARIGTNVCVSCEKILSRCRCEVDKRQTKLGFVRQNGNENELHGE